MDIIRVSTEIPAQVTHTETWQLCSSFFFHKIEHPSYRRKLFSSHRVRIGDIDNIVIYCVSHSYTRASWPQSRERNTVTSVNVRGESDASATK